MECDSQSRLMFIRDSLCFPFLLLGKWCIRYEKIAHTPARYEKGKFCGDVCQKTVNEAEYCWTAEMIRTSVVYWFIYLTIAGKGEINIVSQG